MGLDTIELLLVAGSPVNQPLTHPMTQLDRTRLFDDAILLFLKMLDSPAQLSTHLSELRETPAGFSPRSLLRHWFILATDCYDLCSDSFDNARIGIHMQ